MLCETGRQSDNLSFWRVRIAAAVIVVAVLATYWNSLRVPFFFDDPVAITENPTIRNLTKLSAVLSPPLNGSGATGRPVVNLSLAVNYAIGGTSPTGYHVTNIVLHALAALALFGVIRRTLRRPSLRERFGAASLPLAFGAALLWSLHPLQTESVTCVIQRTEVLVGLFYLLTLYLFIRAIDEPKKKRWAVLAIGACFTGMASKEVMVSAPLMILLYDRTFAAGSFAEAWRMRRRFYLGLGASWLLLGFMVLSLGGARGEVAGLGVGPITWWSYALKQCEAILLYLRLTGWPQPLVVFYGIGVVTNPADVWLEFVLLSALVAAAVVALWRSPMLGFLGMWFFAILAPSSSVVPLVSQTVAEHRMYLPLVAPLVLAVAGAYGWAGRRSLPLVGLAALACAAVSIARNNDYRSELSIWNDTVAKVPNNERARINLAIAYQAAGRDNDALEQLKETLRLVPNQPEALNNLASLLLQHNRAAEAVEPSAVAVRVKPKFGEAHNNLGTALVQTGRLAEGLQHLEIAVQLRPDLAEPHCNYAGALIESQRIDEGIREAEIATRLNPRLALAHFYLALGLLRQNQFDRARPELEAAVRIQPNYADAHLNLGSICYQAGDLPKAIFHFEAAVRANPSADGHYNLASAYFRSGRADDAIAHYREAIRLQPDYAEAYFNLGLLLAQSAHRTEAIEAFENMLRLRPDDQRPKNALEQLGGSKTQK
jgi:tetratricopeptide (TPR) repeat protein